MRVEAEPSQEERSGVAAAEVVLKVLTAFVGAEPMVMLKTLSERAGMHPAKVHRYLVSLCREGFVRQDPETGLYQLADGALQLGLAAIESVDLTVVARPILRSLREKTRLSSVLATWNVAGPVVALQELEPAPLMLTTRVGSPLPILTTATGLTFCAWLPRSTVERALAHEINGAREGAGVRAGRDLADAGTPFDAKLQEIRRTGIASSSGQMNANVHGWSAPVFDGTGHIVSVLSVLGVAGQVDLSLNGIPCRLLKSHALQLSRELGWAAEPDVAL